MMHWRGAGAAAVGGPDWEGIRFWVGVRLRRFGRDTGVQNVEKTNFPTRPRMTTSFGGLYIYPVEDE
jgi:hypothetical protein